VAEAGEETLPDVIVGQQRRIVPVRAAQLRGVVEQIGRANQLTQLASLLQTEGLHARGGEHGVAVRRCLQYVSGLIKEGETVLAAWPVISCNEWAMQQERVLVLTSHALYRLAFKGSSQAIDHFSRCSLGNIKRIERGRRGFRVCLTEPDGRENPLIYFWSEYVQKGTPRDARYERVYYPVESAEVPHAVVMGTILNAIKAANAILCRQVGAYLYVSQLEMVDSQPEPSTAEIITQRLTASLDSLRAQ